MPPGGLMEQSRTLDASDLATLGFKDDDEGDAEPPFGSEARACGGTACFGHDHLTRPFPRTGPETAQLQSGATAANFTIPRLATINSDNQVGRATHGPTRAAHTSAPCCAHRRTV